MQELPLSALRPGESAVVQQIVGPHGGGGPRRRWWWGGRKGGGAGRGIVARLASLGFTPGVEVTMVQNYGRGPLIVEVRGTRVALGRREATRVLVSREVL